MEKNVIQEMCNIQMDLVYIKYDRMTQPTYFSLALAYLVSFIGHNKKFETESFPSFHDVGFWVDVNKGICKIYDIMEQK